MTPPEAGTPGNQTNVPFKLVDSLFDDAGPGHARWWRNEKGDEGFNFICPCGCGAVLGVQTASGNGKSCWEWDGDRAKPTIKPSIRRTDEGGCGWHGHLVAGEFVPC